MAHSITFVALFSSTWTCEARGSSGSSAAGVADFNEKRVPATLADSFADCELNSHDRELGRPDPGLELFDNFFLFNVIAAQLWRTAKKSHVDTDEHNKMRSLKGRKKCSHDAEKIDVRVEISQNFRTERERQTS